MKAQCDWYNISVYPKTRQISKNPIIVIEGLASGIDVIFALQNNNSLYFKSDNSKIKLKIREVCFGQVMVAQIVLLPETTLTPGTEYTLVTDNLPYGENLNRWDSLEQKIGPIKYQVRNSAVPAMPKMVSTPIKIENYVSPTSCGINEYVTFDYKLSNSSQYLFKAKVKNIKTGRTVSYYIWSYDSKISIGHSSCGGPFDYEKNGLYQLQLLPLDEFGNFCTPTNPINFRNPS